MSVSRVLLHLERSVGQLSAAIEAYEEYGGDSECRDRMDDISDQLREVIRKINGGSSNGEKDFLRVDRGRNRIQTE